VACGATVQFTGTELDLGGLVYCHTDKDHSGLGLTTIAQIGSFSDADISNLNRSKCELVCFPINDIETRFRTNVDYNAQTALEQACWAYPYNNSTSPINDSSAFGNGACPMMIMFSGKAGAPVYVEIVQHLEFCDGPAEPMSTPTHADPVGTAHVLAAASHAIEKKQSNPGKKFGHLMLKGLEQVAVAAAPMAKSMVADFLTGGEEPPMYAPRPRLTQIGNGPATGWGDSLD